MTGMMNADMVGWLSRACLKVSLFFEHQFMWVLAKNYKNYKKMKKPAGSTEKAGLYFFRI